MKAIAAAESIAKTIATQSDQRLTGELTFRLVFNSGGIRRLICDISEMSCRHFEITEEQNHVFENGNGNGKKRTGTD